MTIHLFEPKSFGSAPLSPEPRLTRQIARLATRQANHPVADLERFALLSVNDPGASLNGSRGVELEHLALLSLGSSPAGSPFESATFTPGNRLA
jgi:hypothetical protein